MKLADLTFEDGLAFLDSMTHAYQGTVMSPQTKKRYKCALRSFSRFLANTGLLHDDLFFSVTIE